MKNIFLWIYAATIYILVSACTGGKQDVTVRHEGERNNVIEVSEQIISITDHLPNMHTHTGFISDGDTMLLHDPEAADLQITAYDINSEKTVGRFGKFGNGPGEISNTGAHFYSKTHGKLYAINANRNKFISFTLSEAIADTNYNAIDEYDLSVRAGDNIITNPYYINDSTVICNLFVPNMTGGPNSMTTRIANYNLITHATTIIDSIAPNEPVRGPIAVSEKHGKIFACDGYQDKIRLFSLNGKLLTYIYGPEYQEKIDRHRSYFSTPVWCNDKVAAIYNGTKSSIDRENIIIFDKDGNYIATLKFPFTIYDIAYHERTGRLYLSTYGEPQFGYIELDKVLEGKNK